MNDSPPQCVVDAPHQLSAHCTNLEFALQWPKSRRITDFRYPQRKTGASLARRPRFGTECNRRESLLRQQPFSHHAPVAAVLLGLVQRLVGAGDPFLDFLMELELGNPHRGTDREFHCGVRRRELR